MSNRVLLTRDISSTKHVLKQLGKLTWPHILTVALLLTGLSGLIACGNVQPFIPPYIPPNYLDCIEISPFMLGDYYFNYKPLYPWFPTADEAFTGKAIIMKNIKITEEMIETRTKSFFKVNNYVLIKPLDLSQMGKIKVGDMVDILGLCKGISDQWVAVVLEDCFIEPSGILNLPLKNGGSQGVLTY